MIFVVYNNGRGQILWLLRGNITNFSYNYSLSRIPPAFPFSFMKPGMSEVWEMREGIRLSHRGLGNIFHYFSLSRGSRPGPAFGVSPHIPGTSPRARGISKEFCWDVGNVQHEQGWSWDWEWYLGVPKAWESFSMEIPEKDRAQGGIRGHCCTQSIKLLIKRGM